MGSVQPAVRGMLTPSVRGMLDLPGSGGGGGGGPSYSKPLIAHFDFSDETTLFQDTAGLTPISAADQMIKRANDKSASGLYATANVGLYGPYYRTAQQNGLSTGESAASNDGALNGNAPIPYTDHTKATVFAIAKVNNANSGGSVMGNSSTDSNNFSFNLTNNTNATFRYSIRGHSDGGYSNSLFTSSNPLNGVYHLLTFVWDWQSNAYVRLNGVASTPATHRADTYVVDTFSVFSRYGKQGRLAGFIGEVRVYDGILTADEIAAEEVILQAKWATPALP